MQASIEAKTPQDLATEGGKLYKNGAYASAASVFTAAENAYQSQGDLLKAAEMANNCSVAWLQAGEAQSALNAVADTIEIFATHNDELHQAMAYGNRAAALEALAQYDHAIQDYAASAELLKKVDADELRLDVMKSLSALQLKTGHSLEALVTMQAGVEGLKKPKMRQRILQRLLDMPAKLMKR